MEKIPSFIRQFSFITKEGSVLLILKNKHKPQLLNECKPGSIYLEEKTKNSGKKSSSNKNLKKKCTLCYPLSKFNPVRQVVTSAGFQFARIQQKAVKHWQLNSPKIPSALCIFHLQTIPTANQTPCVLRSNYPASYRAEGWSGLFQQLHFWESMQIKHNEKNQTRQTGSKASTTVSQRHPCPLHPPALY